MAGKLDRESGVFTIVCESQKMVYVGKSTGVGVAIRSAKSKLKKGAFHNSNLQDQYNLSPNTIVFGKAELLSKEEDDMTLIELADLVRGEWIDSGFIPYNDLEIITITRKETEIVDVLENLVGKSKVVVEKVIRMLDQNKITAQGLSDYLDPWD